jgi:hypothetical protein
MKRLMAAGIVAVSLVFAWHEAHAGGQPQCDKGQNAAAAPGQKYGTSDDVAAKKEVDAQKYQTAGANSATEACPEPSSAQKQ